MCTAKKKCRKLEANIPRKGISGPQSQFPYSCVCERIIYSHDGAAVSAGGNMWTDPGTKSLTDIWMWKLGLRPCYLQCAIKRQNLQFKLNLESLFFSYLMRSEYSAEEVISWKNYVQILLLTYLVHIKSTYKKTDKQESTWMASAAGQRRTIFDEVV